MVMDIGRTNRNIILGIMHTRELAIWYTNWSYREPNGIHNQSYEHAWGLNIGIFDWIFKGRNPSEVNMKKILSLILLILLSYSCCDKIDSKLMQFTKEIIENPERLNNLQKNYPDLYSDDYFNMHLMGDSEKIKRTIDFINLKFKKEYKSSCIKVSDLDGYKLSSYLKINKIEIRDKNIKLSDFFEFTIWVKNYSMDERNTGIRFIFIKINNNYYICDISGIKNLGPNDL